MLPSTNTTQATNEQDQHNTANVLTAEEQLTLLLQQQRQSAESALDEGTSTAYVRFLITEALHIKAVGGEQILSELLKFPSETISKVFIQNLKSSTESQELINLVEKWILHHLDRGQNLSTVGSIIIESNLVSERLNSPERKLEIGVCAYLYERVYGTPDSLEHTRETLEASFKSISIEDQLDRLNPLILQKLLEFLRENNIDLDAQLTLQGHLYQAHSSEPSIRNNPHNMPMLTAFLTDIGPQCTRSVSSLADAISQFNVTSRNADAALTEAQAAELIVFITFHAYSVKSNGSSLDDELATSLLNNIARSDENGNFDNSRWNTVNVSKYLSSQEGRLNWLMVSQIITTLPFRLRHVSQCEAFFHLFPGDFPQDVLFNSNWKNIEGQLTLFQYMLQLKDSSYNVHLSSDEREISQVIPQENASIKGTLAHKCFACTAFVSRVFHLSESLPPLARDVFVIGLLSVPEIIMCSLVRLETDDQNKHQGVGERLKNDLFNEVINRFFKFSKLGGGQQQAGATVAKYSKAFAKMYNINPQIFGNACVKSYRSCGGPNFAQARYIALILNALPDSKEREFVLLLDVDVGIQISLIASDSEVISLQSWLSNRTESSSSNNEIQHFLYFLLKHVNSYKNQLQPRKDLSTFDGPMVSFESIDVIIRFLQGLDASVKGLVIPDPLESGSVSQTSNTVQTVSSNLINQIYAKYPNLRSKTTQGISTSNRDEIEEIANGYFSRIYTSEQSISEVIAMLKKFKASGNQRENDIFACMITNLFDEYRFFSKYPEKELRITGILFGQLIQNELVTSITLGIALRYVLEALRKPPGPGTAASGGGSNGKMFRFGMFALEQFKTRLHEWPQYCSHIVQIKHLKDYYAELVAEIEMTKAENDAISNNPEEKKIAVFGPGLGRSVNSNINEEDDTVLAPPDQLSDKITLLINNLSPSNCEEKANELRSMINPDYFAWLAQYFVQKRIPSQPNFHSLYLQFIDFLGDWGKELITYILSSAYISIGKLLRSSKITTSSSERSVLKNLGSWLGNITLARNRPILQIQLDCKELLYQGYETGMLIAVTPFVAKILEGSKHSVVFQPPNPWVMALLSVFKALYNIHDLKMNIKFEVEVLCKNLNIRLEDIDATDASVDLNRRISPVKERNPDFNVKANTNVAASVAKDEKGPVSAQQPNASNPTSSHVATTSQTAIVPTAAPASVVLSIPNLSQHVKLSVNIAIPDAKVTVSLALDRAIREVIQPIVDRSVTIACITTKELVTKDFSMEPDENKVRRAAQLMVSNLAGSLALVTCREPLRSAFSSHLGKCLLNSNKQLEPAEVDTAVQTFTMENLDLGCKLIENAATEKALIAIDETLNQTYSLRKKHRELNSSTVFRDTTPFNVNSRFPAALPDVLKPKPVAGLRAEQLLVYEAFERNHHRNAYASNTNVIGQPQASQRAGPPQGQPVPGNLVAPPSSGSPSRPAVVGTGQKPSILETLVSFAARLDNTVTSTLQQQQQPITLTISMLPNDHDICKIIVAFRRSCSTLTPMSDQDMNQVLSFCQSVFKRLYEINVGLEGMLRLEALVSLLKQVQESGVNLLRSNLNNWITFAPVDTAVQVKGHRRILMLLLREKLIGKSAVDGYLARNLTINNSGNDQQSDKWLDFAGWFVKTATVERICTASDFPNTMDYLQHFVKSQDSVSSGSNIGLVQAVKRLLDEFQLTSQDAILNKMAVPPSVPSKPIASTLSSDLAGATFKAFEATLAIAKNDPPGMRSQVMFLLDSWLRVYDETSGNEKTVPVIQFLQLLQQHGVGKSEEQTERFFRFSTELVVEASIKSVLKDGTGSKLMGSLNYNVLDAYAKLVILLVQYMNTGGSSEKVAIQRVNLLNKVLGITVRTLMTNYEYTKQQTGQHWDQRPWFRLLLNLIQDLGAPSAIMDPIRPSILSVFGSALHVIQPCVVPGYSFAWLQLISHRMFLSNLMLLPNSKGWALAHQLLIDLFIFLEPHLRSADMNDAIKHLYNGTLRVLLVLVHDFPSFLAGYHLSFCNVIPENCVQLRNLILSASPKGMVMPDPFTPNLKIDHLPEIGRSPSIKSNVIGPILSLQSDLDNYLTTRQSSNFLQSLLPRLLKDGTDEIDIPRVNSLVLYVGMQAIARLQSGFQHLQIAQTPEMEVLQKLMDFDERSRYIALNAIANQLRYPSTHSHYFSCVMLFLFSETDDEGVKEQVTRVLLERLISHRPHPWALIITFVELLKNQRYQFWSYSFTRCATEIEKVFESVARSCMSPSSQPQSHRMVSAVGGESEDL